MISESRNSPKFFEAALKVVEPILTKIQFHQYSILIKGGAVYYVRFKNNNTIVLFIYGPPEFEIEMVITTARGEFEGKDLIRIPIISNWMNNNRYEIPKERNMETELLWYIDLLKFSLPYIE